ncbi:MAG TPA: DUF2207 domain-containing protein [Herpetosiphonaceae bacterium]
MLYRLMIVLVLLALPATALAQSSPQLHWERYDNIVEIRADGSVQVREQQELVVDSGPARGMTRTFETGNSGAISNIQVFEDGQLLTRRGDTSIRDAGTYAGGDDGSQATIRVNFRDPSADRHSITIQYVINRTLVAGSDRATFDWNFFWGDASAPEIRSGSVRISFPGSVGSTQLDADASGVSVRQSSTSNSVYWELTQPIQGRQLGVSVAFPRTLLAQNAQFRSAGTTRPAVPNTPSNPTTNPVPGAAVGLGIGGVMLCLFVAFFLFIAFMIIRAAARSQRRNFGGPMPGYDQGDPFGSPYGPRRRRRYGGWGGGFFPPIIITPPHQPHHGPYDNNPSPFDNTPFDGGMGGGSSSWGDSGGGSSSWGDSGGGSSSWGDSGGGSSSWGDMGGGGGGWGGGGDSGGGGGGGSGGGSFD